MTDQAERYLEAARLQAANVETLVEQLKGQKGFKLDFTINISHIVSAMAAIISVVIIFVSMQNRMDGFEAEMKRDKEQRNITVAQRDEQINLLREGLQQTNDNLKDYVKETGTQFKDLQVKMGQFETMLGFLLPPNFNSAPLRKP